MKSKLFVLLLLGGIVPVCALRSETADSLRNGNTGEVISGKDSPRANDTIGYMKGMASNT